MFHFSFHFQSSNYELDFMHIKLVQRTFSCSVRSISLTFGSKRINLRQKFFGVQSPTNRRDTSHKKCFKSCFLISNENTLNTSAISIMRRERTTISALFRLCFPTHSRTANCGRLFPKRPKGWDPLCRKRARWCDSFRG